MIDRNSNLPPSSGNIKPPTSYKPQMIFSPSPPITGNPSSHDRKASPSNNSLPSSKGTTVRSGSYNSNNSGGGKTSKPSNLAYGNPSPVVNTASKNNIPQGHNYKRIDNFYFDQDQTGIRRWVPDSFQNCIFQY